MRRTGIALIALVTLAIALGVSGSGALGITNGPLSASPDSVSFLHVAQGTSQTITETLTNNSPTSTTLNIQDVSLSGVNKGDFSLSNDTCMTSQSTLNPNDQCSVDITFSPSQNGGESASLDITDDDTADGTTQSIDLGGTGVATQFSLSGPIDFGDQRVGTTSGVQTEIVTNNTDYAANPTGPSASGDFNATGCTGSVPERTRRRTTRARSTSRSPRRPSEPATGH